MEDQERQRRLFIVVSIAVVDALVIGVALFFVWMASRGASSGPAVPTPTPETEESGSMALIWVPLALALLMPLTTLPIILLLGRRASGGLQRPGEIPTTVVRRLISAFGGTTQPPSEIPGRRPEALPGSEGKGSQQNRLFILLIVAMGAIFLLGAVVLYILMLPR